MNCFGPNTSLKCINWNSHRLHNLKSSNETDKFSCESYKVYLSNRTWANAVAFQPVSTRFETGRWDSPVEGFAFRDQLYKIGLPGKSILEDYFQENMNSRRPKNQFSGKTYFYTFASRSSSSSSGCPFSSIPPPAWRGVEAAPCNTFARGTDDLFG